MLPQSTDDLGAQVALLQSPILRDRAQTIPQEKSQHKQRQKCYPSAREKMLPLYRNIHEGQGCEERATLGFGQQTYQPQTGLWKFCYRETC